MTTQAQKSYKFDFMSKHETQYKLSKKTIFCILAMAAYLLIDLTNTSKIEKKAAMIDLEIYSQTLTAHVQYDKALENNEVDKAINALEKLKKLKTTNLNSPLRDVSINITAQEYEAYIFNDILEGNYNYNGKNNSYILKSYPEKLVQYVNNNLSEVVNNLDQKPEIKFNCNWYSPICMLITNRQKYEVEIFFTNYKDNMYKLKQKILYKNEHKIQYQDYAKENNDKYHYNLKNKDKPQLIYPDEPFLKYQSLK